MAVRRQNATEEKGLVTAREHMEDPLFLRHILKSLHAEEQFASGKWRIWQVTMTIAALLCDDKEVMIEGDTQYHHAQIT